MVWTLLCVLLAAVFGGVLHNALSAEAQEPVPEHQRRWDLFVERATTFQAMKAYVVFPVHSAVTMDPSQSMEYMVWMHHSGKISFDPQSMGMRTHWDGQAIWHYMFRAPELLRPFPGLEDPLRDLFDELLTGFANSTIRWERPSATGLRGTGNGTYWYGIDLPYKWAEGFHLYMDLQPDGIPFHIAAKYLDTEVLITVRAQKWDKPVPGDVFQIERPLNHEKGYHWWRYDLRQRRPSQIP